jgi:hypothetical protein
VAEINITYKEVKRGAWRKNFTYCKEYWQAKGMGDWNDGILE